MEAKLHRELPDFGVHLLDLALARRIGVEPHASVESSRRVLQKLLFPMVFSCLFTESLY
jgi:hypothetical protein